VTASWIPASPLQQMSRLRWRVWGCQRWPVHKGWKIGSNVLSFPLLTRTEQYHRCPIPNWTREGWALQVTSSVPFNPDLAHGCRPAPSCSEKHGKFRSLAASYVEMGVEEEVRGAQHIQPAQAGVCAHGETVCSK
jgi:hypothetical protein